MSELEALEKLAVIGGKWHDKYVEEVTKFRACRHINQQNYTDYCLDCGYNTWHGPDVEYFLEKAMKDA